MAIERKENEIEEAEGKRAAAARAKEEAELGGTPGKAYRTVSDGAPLRPTSAPRLAPHLAPRRAPLFARRR